MTQTCVIVNPTAGGGRPERKLSSICRWLDREEIQYEIVVTQAPGDATRIAGEAARRGTRTVVAVGGDGTVHEVINGIVGMNVALGILPLGTENVLARELGIPFGVKDAVSLIARHPIIQIDLGQLGGRYFALMTGVGFDAQVVRNLDPYMKRQLSRFSFVFTGMATFPKFHPRSVEIRVNGAEIRTQAWEVLVCNASIFAGQVRIAPTASITDGRFDVCVFADDNRASFFGKLLKTAVYRRFPEQNIQAFQATHLSIQSTDPLPVQIDGEAMSLDRLDFSIQPRALSVVGCPTIRCPSPERGVRHLLHSFSR